MRVVDAVTGQPLDMPVDATSFDSISPETIEHPPGTFTFTATSGVTPNLISGQNLFAFDVSGNDSADATALAAAINAAPVLQHFVFAIPVAAVVRIFSRKARYLLEDCNEALIKIKMVCPRPAATRVISRRHSVRAWWI